MGSLRDLVLAPGLTAPAPQVHYWIVCLEHKRWTNGRPWVVIEAIDGSISHPWEFTSFRLATEWVGVCLDEGSATFRKAIQRWASGLGWGPMLAVTGERGDPYIKRLIDAGILPDPRNRYAFSGEVGRR